MRSWAVWKCLPETNVTLVLGAQEAPSAHLLPVLGGGEVMNKVSRAFPSLKSLWLEESMGCWCSCTQEGRDEVATCCFLLAPQTRDPGLRNKDFLTASLSLGIGWLEQPLFIMLSSDQDHSVLRSHTRNRRERAVAGWMHLWLSLLKTFLRVENCLPECLFRAWEPTFLPSSTDLSYFTFSVEKDPYRRIPYRAIPALNKWGGRGLESQSSSHCPTPFY